MSDSVDDVLTRARAFAEPLLAGESLDTGENVLDHADAGDRVKLLAREIAHLSAPIFLSYSPPPHSSRHRSSAESSEKSHSSPLAIALRCRTCRLAAHRAGSTTEKLRTEKFPEQTRAAHHGSIPKITS